MNKINFYTDDVKSITIEYGNGTIKKYSYTKGTQEPAIETIAEAGDNSGSGTIEITPEDENSQIAPTPGNNNPNQDENDEGSSDENSEDEEEIIEEEGI